jgi:hypothetical protein
MAGIERREYNLIGLDSKPKANMNDFQDKPLMWEQIDDILHNVKMFKQINGL